MKSNFEKCRQQKAENYKRLAKKNQEQAKQTYEAARQIGSNIPMGQPILVGHHSEARHRRDLQRIDNNMRKSIEHDEKAKYYERKAANAEDETRIFSDDPQATQKQKEKIECLERSHKRMKEINAHFRKYGHVCGLQLTDVEKQAIKSNLAHGHGEKKPFASYTLQNSSADIRRNRERLKALEKAEREQTTEKEVNGVRLVDNVEANRLQLFFPGKPSEEIRQQLRASGFRWSPSIGCWQRHRSNAATWKAEKILDMVLP